MENSVCICKKIKKCIWKKDRSEEIFHKENDEIKYEAKHSINSSTKIAKASKREGEQSQ